MNKKQMPELRWIGKENRPQLEPRILLEDPEKSHHAKQRVSENDIFDNQLIDDNLLALKTMEEGFAGKVKLEAMRIGSIRTMYGHRLLGRGDIGLQLQADSRLRCNRGHPPGSSRVSTRSTPTAQPMSAGSKNCAPTNH